MQRSVLVAFFASVMAASAAQGASSQVRMVVTPQGEVTLTLAGQPVAGGSWRLRQETYLSGPTPDAISVGPLVALSAKQDGPGHAVVDERRASATVTYTLALDGEDLRVAAHVVNTDAAHALRPIAFEGPSFRFNPGVPITAELNTWHWTYLQAQGVHLFHPSVASPIGCWWAADDRFAFSIFSASEFDRSFLVTAEYGGHDGVIAASCQPDLFTDRSVPPGGSVDITWSIRVSADRTPHHLIAGYKAEYDRHFPLPMYHSDPRGLAMFSQADAQHVTPANPLGYHSPGCRFDTAGGTASYVQHNAWLERRAGFAGHIFWALGGFNPPMYPPDFDVFPPSVQANIPALVKGFHEQGLRVGLCARPGDGVDRTPGVEPAVYRLSADDADQMRRLADRFRHAMAMGFDLFYLDSIGDAGVNDVRILRHVRDVVGPDVELYSEYCTDVSLPYAGRYCEWVAPGAIKWTSDNQLAELRELCPHAPWLCASRTRQVIPPLFAKLGLAPLIPDAALPQLPPPRDP